MRRLIDKTPFGWKCGPYLSTVVLSILFWRRWKCRRSYSGRAQDQYRLVVAQSGAGLNGNLAQKALAQIFGRELIICLMIGGNAAGAEGTLGARRCVRDAVRVSEDRPVLSL